MIPSFCAYERGMASKISSIGRRRICGTKNEFFVLFCIVKKNTASEKSAYSAEEEEGI